MNEGDRLYSEYVELMRELKEVVGPSKAIDIILRAKKEAGKHFGNPTVEVNKMLAAALAEERKKAAIATRAAQPNRPAGPWQPGPRQPGR